MFDLIVKIRSLELVAITIATGYCYRSVLIFMKPKRCCIVTGVPNKFDLIELGGCMREMIFSLCMVLWSWCSVSYKQFPRSKVHCCQDRNHQTVLFLQSNSLTSSWSSDCHETCYETHLHTLTPSHPHVSIASTSSPINTKTMAISFCAMLAVGKF